MSILGPTDYTHFGGTHWETAAMKNTLAHAGLTAPHTGKPLSEALCLGISGGIAAGYSFCPSIPAWEKKLGLPPEKLPANATREERYISQFRCGSGISIPSRYHAFSTKADKYDDFFKRLGRKTVVKESTGLKAAHQNLLDGLRAGRPVILWTAAMRLTWHGWAGTCGVYSTVCHGVDEAKKEAHLNDRGATSTPMSLEDLEFLRNRVCSLKNRSLWFEPGKPFDEKTVKKAVSEGLAACAADFKKPALGTFNLPGLLEWSKVIAATKNKKGWPVVYPGGNLYLPLRDVFDSIETAATGGGLMRGMYADFLDEAATILNKASLKDAAKAYRALASQWTQLAEACLPDKVKPFKRTKDLLHKRSELVAKKGEKGAMDVVAIGDELNAIEKAMRKQFPLDAKATNDLLESLSAKIAVMHTAETEAAKAL